MQLHNWFWLHKMSYTNITAEHFKVELSTMRAEQRMVHPQKTLRLPKIAS